MKQSCLIPHLCSWFCYWQFANVLVTVACVQSAPNGSALTATGRASLDQQMALCVCVTCHSAHRPVDFRCIGFRVYTGLQQQQRDQYIKLGVSSEAPSSSNATL
jgi:hypothetical protein